MFEIWDTFVLFFAQTALTRHTGHFRPGMAISTPTLHLPGFEPECRKSRAHTQQDEHQSYMSTII